jgi:UDP-glucose 4-epimerase
MNYLITGGAGFIGSHLADLLIERGHSGEVYNVGSVDEITILELADRVRAVTESTSEVIHLPYAIAYESNFEDMQRRVPSIEKIGRAIGWEPSIGIEAILESVAEHHRVQELSVV